MNITKTKFLNFMKCESYYGLFQGKKNKEEENPLDEYKQFIISEEEGEDDSEKDVSPNIDAMLPYFRRVEEEALKSTLKTFGGKATEQKKFEKSYERNNYLCYLDIYNEGKDNLNIIEVKATTTSNFYKDGILSEYYEIIRPNIIQLKEINDESMLQKKNYIKQRMKLFNKEDSFGKYVYDLFFQAFVMDEEVKNADYYLAILNNQYVFDGTYDNEGKPVYNPDNNGNELITFIYLGNLYEEYMIQIKNDIVKLERIMESPSPNKKLAKYCCHGGAMECDFSKVCWKDFPEKLSINNYNLRHLGWVDENGVKRELFDLINEGYKYALDIPDTWIERDNQKIQRNAIANNEIFISREKIEAGLTQIKYPIYHLDFETFPCPIPRFKGEKPYSQSLFQFSIHVEKESFNCDKEINHIGFLADSHKDVRFELTKAMLDSIDVESGGTVLVYNQSFEKTRIKELGQIFPEYQEKLEKLNSMIFDLMYLLKSNNKMYQGLGFIEKEAKMFNYYNKELNGSFSIKKVLPIFTKLSYEGMPIGNGSDAMYTYANEEMLKANQQELTEYCKQDTWAMVEILWGLKKIVNEGERNNA